MLSLVRPVLGVQIQTLIKIEINNLILIRIFGDFKSTKGYNSNFVSAYCWIELTKVISVFGQVCEKILINELHCFVVRQRWVNTNENRSKIIILRLYDIKFELQVENGDTYRVIMNSIPFLTFCSQCTVWLDKFSRENPQMKLSFCVFSMNSVYYCTLHRMWFCTFCVGFKGLYVILQFTCEIDECSVKMTSVINSQNWSVKIL